METLPLFLQPRLPSVFAVIGLLFALLHVDGTSLSGQRTVVDFDNLSPGIGSGGVENVCTGIVASGDQEQLHRIKSPNYPNNYPPNLQCIRIIRAPRGYAILLDFDGEYFEIEPNYEPVGSDRRPNSRQSDGDDDSTEEQCNDFLEVRDGKYGFSPLIARFCGKEFPRRIVQSYSGFMWVRFKSDALLEYKGFSAKYRFVTLPPGRVQYSQDCLISRNSQMDILDDGIVDSSLMMKFFLAYRNTSESIECVWKIDASKPEYQLRILMEEFQLGVPNSCAENFMEVYGGTTADKPLRQYCGATASNVATPEPRAYIRIFATRHSLLSSDPPLRIRALYTSYTESKNCSEQLELFSCGDDSCIPNSLVCNGRPNCLYKKDEQGCKTGKMFKPVVLLRGPYFIILMVVCAVIGGIMTCAIVLNYCPRFKRQQAKYDQFLRQLSQDVSSNTATVATARYSSCGAASGEPRRHSVAVLYPNAAPNHGSNVQLHLSDSPDETETRARINTEPTDSLLETEENWRRPISPKRRPIGASVADYTKQPVNIHPYLGLDADSVSITVGTTGGILRNRTPPPPIQHQNRVSAVNHRQPPVKTVRSEPDAVSGYTDNYGSYKSRGVQTRLSSSGGGAGGGNTNLQRTPDVILNGLIATGRGAVADPGGRASSASTTSHGSATSTPKDKVRLAGAVRPLTTFTGARESSLESAESSLDNFQSPPPPPYYFVGNKQQQRRGDSPLRDELVIRTGRRPRGGGVRLPSALAELDPQTAAHLDRFEEEPSDATLSSASSSRKRTKQRGTPSTKTSATEESPALNEEGAQSTASASSKAKPSVTFEDEIKEINLKHFTKPIRI